jgi:hypothetical protein
MQDDTFPTNADFDSVLDEMGCDHYHCGVDDAMVGFPTIVERFNRTFQRYTSLMIDRDSDIVLVAERLIQIERMLNRHVRRGVRIHLSDTYVSAATANKILGSHSDMLQMLGICNKMLDRYSKDTRAVVSEVDYFGIRVSRHMAHEISMFRETLIRRFGQMIEVM